MKHNYVDIRKIGQIFGNPINKNELSSLIEMGEIPAPQKVKIGITHKWVWDKKILPEFGKYFGYLKPFKKPLTLSFFTTKGGVLKTTLAFNVARSCAINNLRTCVVGLDMQGDITTSLGHDLGLEKNRDIEEIIKKINLTKGLADYFSGQAKLHEIIHSTDLETLHYIPETPELAALNETLGNINRREYWLKEKIIAPLRDKYDVIILDCSPNWNKLITNALVASDFLVSPIECKINNFRNFKLFQQFLKEFIREMKLSLNTLFVPTRYALNKKLSLDISQWYQTHLPNCTQIGIKESIVSEEAQALKISLPEYAPNKTVAIEMKNLLSEIFQLIREKKNLEYKILPKLNRKGKPAKYNNFITA